MNGPEPLGEVIQEERTRLLVEMDGGWGQYLYKGKRHGKAVEYGGKAYKIEDYCFDCQELKTFWDSERQEYYCPHHND